jgi:hypothetical protein
LFSFINIQLHCIDDQSP